MKLKSILIALAVLTLCSSVAAQDKAKSEEQARIQPLITAETKAREALNAKIATLPEAKAFKEAQDALNKATEALNKAAEALPENTAWKEAGAKVLDEAYRIQAAHNLSSREYKPELNPKGELVFSKLVLPKP